MVGQVTSPKINPAPLVSLALPLVVAGPYDACAVSGRITRPEPAQRGLRPPSRRLNSSHENPRTARHWYQDGVCREAKSGARFHCGHELLGEGSDLGGDLGAPEHVDPALRRPGRFDQVVWMGLPDERRLDRHATTHQRSAGKAHMASADVVVGHLVAAPNVGKRASKSPCRWRHDLANHRIPMAYTCTPPTKTGLACSFKHGPLGTIIPQTAAFRAEENDGKPSRNLIRGSYQPTLRSWCDLRASYPEIPGPAARRSLG